MDRIIARLERRFGRFAIPNLPLLIVGGMGVVFILSKLKPEFINALMLDIDLVRRGQVWRLFTYLFIPDSSSLFWILFSLYWVWLIGSSLEAEWGAFKLNAFYFIGMLGTTVAAWVTGHSVGNTYLNATLFFAFATLFPDYEIFLFFILRVKIKWLAFGVAGFFFFRFAMGTWADRGAVIASMANYFLFFGSFLVGTWRGRNLRVRQSARRASSRPPPPAFEARVCAICGVSQTDGADIRVCTCEKCGGPRALCLAHARSH